MRATLRREPLRDNHSDEECPKARATLPLGIPAALDQRSLLSARFATPPSVKSRRRRREVPAQALELETPAASTRGFFYGPGGLSGFEPPRHVWPGVTIVWSSSP